MSFIAESLVKVPANPNGSAQQFIRRAKAFSANSAAALETAVNAWLVTLGTSDTQYVVGAINPYSAANNNHSAVVSYGYFV